MQKIMHLLLTGLTIIVLTACGGSGGDNPPVSPQGIDANVLEDITGNADGIPATSEQINSIDGVSGAVPGVDYSDALAAGTYADSANPTADEIQAVINAVNTPVNGAPTITTAAAQNAVENQTSVVTLAGTDPESDTLSWSITGGADQGTFSLLGAVLTFSATPDFELPTDANTDNVYDVEVTENDGNGNMVAKMINVTVNDAADVVATLADTTGSVNENASTGTAVGSITIIDSGDSAITSITLSGTGFENFEVAANGAITVAAGATLDYEMTSNYSLTAIATNGAGDSNSVDVTITVTDVNEYHVGAVSDSNAAANTVPEDTAVGTSVGITALATDPDGSATVTYALTDDAGRRFTIGPNSGIVTVAGALDYETADEHSIRVQATSSDSSTSSMNMTITVTDVNEDPVGAVSDSNIDANTVPEDAAVGTATGITALATDPDGSATVTYTLTDDAGGRFTIDPDSGVVTVSIALDYETATEHNITVEATSSDSSTSSVNMMITVTDANEYPVGTVSDSNIDANTVPEDAAVGTATGITALATDPDGSATVTYTLTDDAGGRFAIDPDSGVVTVAGTLDYETADEHSIRVQATSSDSSTSSVNMTITVTDVVTYDVIEYNGQQWLDRNLGADAACTDENGMAECYGDLYQWGRRADGHEKRNSELSEILSSTSSPSDNYDFIITNNIEPLNWIDHNETDLWQEPGSANNGVCPSGWSLPTLADFDALNIQKASDAFDKIKLSMCGYRNDEDGLVKSMDDHGVYWTSDIDNEYSRSLHIKPDSKNNYSYGRANGFSIRCIKK